MNVFVKLTLLTSLMILIGSLFFEYIINRPVNTYIQYGLSTLMFIVFAMYLVYFVKELLKILKSE